MGDPKAHWTLEAYVVHNEALRVSEEKFQAERDRRYTEVKNAEEKALRIKEQADRDALQLAREIQTYKDEKANELREQISRERGLYVTQTEMKSLESKIETQLSPIAGFVAGQQGEKGGRISQQQMFMVLIPGLVGFLIVAIGAIVAVAYSVRR